MSHTDTPPTDAVTRAQLGQETSDFSYALA
jgi:hypothetical protein